MKKFLVGAALALMVSTAAYPITANASSQVYTVVSGDTMWKIAQKYDTNLSSIIKANPQIKNFDMIYPGMKVEIPEKAPVQQAQQPTQGATQTVQQEVIRLVNVERAKAGVKPLKENVELSKVATAKSNDMKNNGYFSHTSPTYGSPFDMMKKFGIKYSYAGENIAMGQRTAAEVMKGWMNSPGHKKNILNPNYTEIGVGHAVNSKGTPYWTQMFIRP